MPVNKSRLYEFAWKGFVEQRSLRVEVCSQGQAKAFTTLFDPFKIFFTSYGWYIIGRSHAHCETTVLDPAMVRNVEIVNNRFTVPAQFSLRRLIGSAWQLFESRGDRLNVVVRFSPSVACRVAATKWIASSQLRFREDGSVEWQATVAGTGKLVNWIMSFGESAEVVEPETLRNRIRIQAENMVRKYSRIDGS
jgi:predicted DNA-binding transcriptional regulator YafY